MPTEFDDEQQHDDEQPSGAARRVQDKQAEAEAVALRQENAVLKAGLVDLSDDQRTALLAVVGSDLSSDAVKAKAEALGFLKPAEAAEDTNANAEVATAEEKISAAASESLPSTPPAAVAATWRERLTNAPHAQVQPGSQLYQQVLAEIQAQPNLRMGAVEHDGTFQPL